MNKSVDPENKGQWFGELRIALDSKEIGIARIYPEAPVKVLARFDVEALSCRKANLKLIKT